MNVRGNEVTLVQVARDKSGIKAYRLQWVVENFGFLRKERFHSGPSMQIGNMVSEFKLYRTSTRLSDENLQQYVFLGLDPSPTSKAVFTIMSPDGTIQYADRNLLEMVPFITTKGCFYGFKEDSFTADLVVYCEIATNVRDSGDFLCRAVRAEERSILKDDMKRLLRDEKYWDIALIAGGRTFRAHRAILYARSHYFAEVLSCDYPNSLEFPEYGSDTFEEILAYIYTEKLKNYTIEMALSLLPVSTRFRLDNLKMFLVELIISSMSVEYALDLVIKAHERKEAVLENCAIECIGNNLELALKHEMWQIFLTKSQLVNKLFTFVAKRFVKKVL